MRKAILFLIIFLLLLAAPTAIRYLQYHDLSTEERVLPSEYNPGLINAVDIPETSGYVDEPEMMDGLVLLDKAHDNNFTLEDIARAMMEFDLCMLNMRKATNGSGSLYPSDSSYLAGGPAALCVSIQRPFLRSSGWAVT